MLSYAWWVYFEIPNCQTIFEASHEMFPLHCFTNLEGYNCQVHIWSCSFQQLLRHSLTSEHTLCRPRHQAMEGVSKLKTHDACWKLSPVFMTKLAQTLHWSFLVVACPLSPSLSTLTPAEDPSFPLLRFILSFQLFNFCGIAAWSYFANHQFSKQGHLGGRIP